MPIILIFDTQSIGVVQKVWRNSNRVLDMLIQVYHYSLFHCNHPRKCSRVQLNYCLVLALLYHRHNALIGARQWPRERGESFADKPNVIFHTVSYCHRR